MVKPVFLSDYDAQWPKLFDEYALRIREIVGADLSAIYHIGSTSVPGLCAKPIIDILPTVRDFSRLDTLQPQFEKAGFEWRGERGIPDRRYLVLKGDSGSAMHRCHIHFFSSSNFEVNKHLLFRDYLRLNVSAKKDYAEIKRKLAAEFANDRDAYQAGKEALIGRLTEAAWAQKAKYREPVQINVVMVTLSDDGLKYLLLKRIERRGGFWQSITGAPELNETLPDAARRELFEETGFKEGRLRSLAFSYSFPLDPKMWTATYRPEVINIDEHVYWVEIDGGGVPKLSDEHVESEWVDFDRCIEMLKWESNKTAVGILHQRLKDLGV